MLAFALIGEGVADTNELLGSGVGLGYVRTPKTEFVQRGHSRANAIKDGVVQELNLQARQQLLDYLITDVV